MLRQGTTSCVAHMRSDGELESIAHVICIERQKGVFRSHHIRLFLPKTEGDS